MRMLAVGEALTESGDDFLSAGSSYLIERSKREMVAEDLRLALRLMSA